eukprot:2158205-Prymnesium_polylepis.1
MMMTKCIMHAHAHAHAHVAVLSCYLRGLRDGGDGGIIPGVGRAPREALAAGTCAACPRLSGLPPAACGYPGGIAPGSTRLFGLGGCARLLGPPVDAGAERRATAPAGWCAAGPVGAPPQVRR